MVYDLKNKVVLITGAAAGIGAGVVSLLLEEGVKYVAILDIAETEGIAFQNELNTKYGANKVKFFKVDVTNEDQLFGAFKTVKEEQGYIDVVINNAGIMNDSYKTYKKEIDINFTALVTSTLKALELMRKDEGGKGGAIINVASIAAFIRAPELPIYCGTKAAVMHFSTIMGMDEYYSRTGVRVAAICFGVTNTSLFSMSKLGTFDKGLAESLGSLKDGYPSQKMESAAKGVVDCCKLAKSGSTWVSTCDKPATDISDVLDKTNELLTAVSV